MKIWVLVFCGLFYSGAFAWASRETCAQQAQQVPQRLAYFQDTYETCREQFLNSAKRYVATLPAPEAARVQRGSWKVPSAIDPNLTTDWIYLPPRGKPEGIVIVSSGTHGVEGFMGSAVQRYWFDELMPPMNREHTGVLLIHAVNPYGFKYLRRVTENNVDLNRNFDVSRALFAYHNEGYAKLSALLNPQSAPRYDYLSGTSFLLRAAHALAVQKLAALRSAILRGQYENPKGIYFGGKDFEPHKVPLDDLIEKITAPYRSVMHFDLHTGFGTRGHLHLFPSVVTDGGTRANMKKVFGDYPIDAGSAEEGDFYVTSGEFSHYVMQRMLAVGKTVVPMVVEYGTVDNQGTIGGLASLRLSVLENQLQRFGATPAVTRQIRRDFLAMYFPESHQWRLQTMNATAQWLPVFVDRFTRLH